MPRKKGLNNLRMKNLQKNRTNNNIPPDSDIFIDDAGNTSLDSNACAETPSSAVHAKKRIKLLQQSAKTCTESEVEEEFILVNVNILQELFSSTACAQCGEINMKLQIKSGFGFAHKLVIRCENCEQSTTKYSSDRIVNSDSRRPSFSVNRRMCLAFNQMGKGHSGMEIFSLSMNMTCLNSHAFNSHVKNLHTSSVQSGNYYFQSVRAMIIEAHKDIGNLVDDNGFLNITVSFDGTWQTRGHSSNFAVGCIIDVLTGFVMDFVVMSKLCRYCDKAKATLGCDTDAFKSWFAEHEETCDKNHYGSSPAMEVAAAEILWCRSEAIGFRYVKFVGDGDCKTRKRLHERLPYGPDIQITKEECLNHVSKRMGTALRNIVSEKKKCGITLGGKKYGSLTEKTIKKITRYYSKAIRSNLSSLSDMKIAIYAILDHCRSTDQKPLHKKCPTGSDSWCFFNRSLFEGSTPGSHIKNLHTPLKEHVVQEILPIFQRLAADTLLERCLGGLTQNANESLHSKFWNFCPKVLNATKRRMEMAVHDSVAEFNLGLSTTHVKRQRFSGLNFGTLSNKISQRRDNVRIRKSVARSDEIYKKYQQTLKLAKVRFEKSCKLKEGVTYRSGAC